MGNAEELGEEEAEKPCRQPHAVLHGMNTWRRECSVSLDGRSRMRREQCQECGRVAVCGM